MRAAYEDQSFRASVEEVYNQVVPLYKQLFTYVRRRLFQRYGDAALRPDGPIPAHLLGKLLFTVSKLLFTYEKACFKSVRVGPISQCITMFYRDALMRSVM